MELHTHIHHDAPCSLPVTVSYLDLHVLFMLGWKMFSLYNYLLPFHEHPGLLANETSYTHLQWCTLPSAVDCNWPWAFPDLVEWYLVYVLSSISWTPPQQLHAFSSISWTPAAVACIQLHFLNTTSSCMRCAPFLEHHQRLFHFLNTTSSWDTAIRRISCHLSCWRDSQYIYCLSC